MRLPAGPRPGLRFFFATVPIITSTIWRALLGAHDQLSKCWDKIASPVQPLPSVGFGVVAAESLLFLSTPTGSSRKPSSATPNLLPAVAGSLSRPRKQAGATGSIKQAEKTLEGVDNQKHQPRTRQTTSRTKEKPCWRQRSCSVPLLGKTKAILEAGPLQWGWQAWGRACWGPCCVCLFGCSNFLISSLESLCLGNS